MRGYIKPLIQNYKEFFTPVRLQATGLPQTPDCDGIEDCGTNLQYDCTVNGWEITFELTNSDCNTTNPLNLGCQITVDQGKGAQVLEGCDMVSCHDCGTSGTALYQVTCTEPRCSLSSEVVISCPDGSSTPCGEVPRS